MRRNCETCNVEFDEKELIFGPDPFAEEIYGDDTEVWLCQDCHEQSALDI